MPLIRFSRALTIAISLGVASPSFAQTLGRGEDIGVSWWRVVLLLVLLTGLALSGAWIVHRRGGSLRLLAPMGERRLRVIETTRLSPQAHLCIASCDGAEFLIAVTQNGATVLDRLPAQTDATA